MHRHAVVSGSGRSHSLRRSAYLDLFALVLRPLSSHCGHRLQKSLRCGHRLFEGWRRSLRYMLLLMATSFAICSCAGTRLVAPSAELIVVGRLENLSEEPTMDPDDFLGHGWFNARLHISRVLRGRSTAAVIPVRYFGHSYLQDRTPSRHRLHRDPNGTYFICASPGSSGYRCP